MKVKIGLLPLYLELYDKTLPGYRPKMEKFYRAAAAEFSRRGVAVETAPVCRVAPEFRAAVRGFERAGADAIVTLHLAYSPSLESAGALANSKLPIIALDTTPTFDFGPKQNPDELMFNHGIHGVQDMCNVLLRRGKKVIVEAGHWQRSDVIDRVCRHARAAAMAKTFRDTRTALLGAPFKGMGDFAISAAALKKLTGHEPRIIKPAELSARFSKITEKEILRETAADCARFAASKVTKSQHALSISAGLALRQILEMEKIAAFSVNFLAITRDAGLPVMPFLEISKAMARGIGYAGEGDLLTAALVSILLQAFPQTTFTEMFCPDWKGNRIFLSHMGEVNVELLAGKPELMLKRWIFTDADAPVIAAGCLKEGSAIFVNLAPLSETSFRLILAPCSVTAEKNDRFTEMVRGWFKPLRLPIAEFLAKYSAAGGTHHAALSYKADTTTLRTFGTLMGWETTEII